MSARFLMTSVALLLLLTGGGCWNRREPESLALVMGLGFDYDAESENYEAVVDIAKPTPMEGGGGEKGDVSGSIAPSARGKNLFVALRKIEPVISRDLFWGHSEIVVVSEDLARRGLQPVLDFYSRERQSRLTNFILITDDKPKDLLQVQLPLETEIGVGIRSQIMTAQTTQSVTPLADVRMVLIDQHRPGKDLFLPRIRIVEEESAKGGESAEEDQPRAGDSQQEERIEVCGGAAFQGDRMVGWLEAEATKGALYITGSISRATMILPCPAAGCSCLLAAEVHRSSSRMEASFVQGKPKIRLTISVEGRLQEKDCFSPFTRSYEEKLHKLLAESVRQSAETAIKRGQELGSDIFGFGNVFYRKYPREWKELEKDWPRHFAELEIEIEVYARILRPGLVVDPPSR